MTLEAKYCICNSQSLVVFCSATLAHTRKTTASHFVQYPPCSPQVPALMVVDEALHFAFDEGTVQRVTSHQGTVHLYTRLYSGW